MAKFIGMVSGARGEVSRTGTAKSGIDGLVASYEGCVKTRLWVQDGKVYASVWLDTWQGGGSYIPIYRGPIEPTVEQLADAFQVSLGRAKSERDEADTIRRRNAQTANMIR